MSSPGVHVPALVLTEILDLYAGVEVTWRPSELKLFVAGSRWGSGRYREALGKVETALKTGCQLNDALEPVVRFFDFPFRSIPLGGITVPSGGRIAKTRGVIMHPVLSFLSNPDISSLSEHFMSLIQWIISWRQTLSWQWFDFALNTCIEQFLSVGNGVFTVDMAKTCFARGCVIQWYLIELVACDALTKCHNDVFACCVDVICSQFRVLPRDCIKGKLLTLAKSEISQFNSVALRLLAHVCAAMPVGDDGLTAVVRKLAADIRTKVDEHVVFVCDSRSIVEGGNISDGVSEEEGTLIDGLCPVPAEVFDAKIDVNIPDCEEIQSLAEFLRSVPSHCRKVFFESFIPIDDTHVLILISLLMLCGDDVMTHRVIDLLVSTNIFCPNVTVFRRHDDYNLVLSVRAILINFLISRHPQVVTKILDKSHNSSLLYAEIIGRIHAKLLDFDISSLSDESTLMWILWVAEELERNDKGMICRQARSTILLFVFDILEGSETSRRCFNSASFAQVFTWFLTRKSLVKSTLGALLKFLRKCLPCDAIMPTVDNLCGVISLATDEELVISIIITVNSAMAVNHAICGPMAKLVSYITTFLEKSPTEQCMSSVLQFCLHVSVDFEQNDLRKLARLICTIESDGVNSDIVKTFLCLMMQSRSASMGMIGIIQRYSVVLPLLSLFASEQSAFPLFEYMYLLCRSSSFNCQRCHTAELDMLIIEMLTCSGTSCTFRGLEFKYVIRNTDFLFDMLCYMLSIVTSPAVVVHCIPLMYMSQMFLGKLNLTLRNHRQDIMPISDQGPVFNQTMLMDDTDEAIAIRFWLRWDTILSRHVGSRIEIMTLSVSDTTVCLVGDAGSLTVKVYTATEEMSGMLSSEFPANTWTQVHLTVMRKNNGVIFRYASGNEDAEEFFFPALNFYCNDAVLDICGSIKEGSPIAGAVLLFVSDVQLFRFADPPRVLSRWPNERDNAKRSLLKMAKGEALLFPSLSDILPVQGVFDNLIPLFMMFDDSWAGFPEVFLDALSIVIGRDNEIKVDFGLVARMLSKQMLTYSIYERLVVILEACHGSAMSRNIIDHIILNFGLWMKCKDILKISRHWGSVLPQGRISLICSVRSFHGLFGEICYYFCAKNADERYAEIDLYTCRQNVNKLALAVAIESFTFGDAMDIVLYIMQVNDRPEICSLLDLFLHIAKNCQLPLSFAPPIFHLFEPGRTYMFIPALRVLCRVTATKFSRYGNALLTLMDSGFYTPDIFNGLTEMLPEYPCIISILIHVALGMGNDQRMKAAALLMALDAEKVDFDDLGWLMYVLMLAAKSAEARPSVISFISRVVASVFSIRRLGDTIDFVYFFGVLVGVDFSDCVAQITRLVVQYRVGKDEGVLLFGPCITALMFGVEWGTNREADISVAYVRAALEQSPQAMKVKAMLPRNESLLATAVHIFRSIPETDYIDVTEFFGKYLLDVARKEPISLTVNDRLESIFHVFFDAVSAIRTEANERLYVRLRKLWLTAVHYGLRFIRPLTQNVSLLAEVRGRIANKECITERSFRRFRKYVMHEFSVWAKSNMFMSQTKRNFRYTLSFTQMRLRKSLNEPSIEHVAYQQVDGTIAEFPCKLVKVMKETDSLMRITSNSLWINNKERPLRHIKSVLMRYRGHKRNAIEIIMKTGESFLLDFGMMDALDVVQVFIGLGFIKLVQNSDPVDFWSYRNDTEQWRKGSIGNFQYIMAINMLSGRSFCDPGIYPIVPWILQDFAKIEAIIRTIDNMGQVLQFPREDWRDFSLPICAQSPERREKLHQVMVVGTVSTGEKCIFMAAPSNVMIVSHWLVRQPPFTSLHKITQDGHFGYTNQLFQSLSRASRQVLAGNSCWELVPEFYSQPEMFVNMNKYDMGEGVDSVFTLKEAYEFVYLMRKVFESDYVSQNLHKWIDLLFGVDANQIEKCNVYDPLLYDDVWSKYPEVDSALIDDTLTLNGQLPARLFNAPHPAKHVAPESIATVVSIRRMSVLSDFFVVNRKLHVGELRGHVSLLSFSHSQIVVGVCNEGNICRVSVDIDGVKKSDVTVVMETSFKNVISSSSLGTFVVADTTNGSAIELTSTTSRSLRRPLCRWSSISTQRETVVMCDDLGLIRWWFVEDQIETEFNFAIERVTCLAISRSLGVIAIACTSGFVCICDLADQQLSFRCDLENRSPRSVLISASSGFIVVYCDDRSISLFGPNGHEIRRVSLIHDLVTWKVFVARDGFDYLMIADTKGRVQLCELFYLNFSDPFYESTYSVSLLEYHSPTQTAFIMTTDGQIVHCKHT